ncbi:MAG: VTT domain-containing protein [Dehalococcoidales bacterium]
MDETKRDQPEKKGMWGWIRRNIISLAGLLVVIIITGGIFYFYKQYPDKIDELKTYGYLGAFVISIILNATIILPVGNMAILMAIGATMPSPVIVGLVGGLGAAIGELTGYIAGRSGRDLVAKSKMFNRVESWVRKWGMLPIFIFSMVPFFFDLVGIAAGALRIPLWKFFVPCWLGRTILYVVMVSIASLGLKLLPWFG